MGVLLSLDTLEVESAVPESGIAFSDLLCIRLLGVPKAFRLRELRVDADKVTDFLRDSISTAL